MVQNSFGEFLKESENIINESYYNYSLLNIPHNKIEIISYTDKKFKCYVGKNSEAKNYSSSALNTMKTTLSSLPNFNDSNCVFLLYDGGYDEHMISSDNDSDLALLNDPSFYKPRAIKKTPRFIIRLLPSEVKKNPKQEVLFTIDESLFDVHIQKSYFDSLIKKKIGKMYVMEYYNLEKVITFVRKSLYRELTLKTITTTESPKNANNNKLVSKFRGMKIAKETILHNPSLYDAEDFPPSAYEFFDESGTLIGFIKKDNEKFTFVSDGEELTFSDNNAKYQMLPQNAVKFRKRFEDFLADLFEHYDYIKVRQLVPEIKNIPKNDNQKNIFISTWNNGNPNWTND